VAVVAGATRGAGRGIALALGEAGATVVCTGRSSRDRSLRSDYDRPETIEETAELVCEVGGNGVAIAVDHLDPARVAALAQRLRAEFGHVDVLVNDIWGAEILKGGPSDWNTPIWEHDLADGLRIVRLAVETHLITSHHVLGLMVDRPGSLLSRSPTAPPTTTPPVTGSRSSTTSPRSRSIASPSRRGTSSLSTAAPRSHSRLGSCARR